MFRPQISSHLTSLIASRKVGLEMGRRRHGMVSRRTRMHSLPLGKSVTDQLLGPRSSTAISSYNPIIVRVTKYVSCPKDRSISKDLADSLVQGLFGFSRGAYTARALVSLFEQ